jgi:hypothetical protein
MATRNRKMFDTLKDAGYSDNDIGSFCEAYLELVAEAMIDGLLRDNKGINETELAERLLKDKLIYKRNGKLYIED